MSRRLCRGHRQSEVTLLILGGKIDRGLQLYMSRRRVRSSSATQVELVERDWRIR
jgi:hypothetical protein